MKVSPTADYTVRVLRQEWEERSPLYAGIFAVALNHDVDIAFVPDLSEVAPPWDERLLPDDLDEVATIELARLATALLSSYVVTPSEGRAGAEDTFTWRSDPPADYHVVYYVTAAEFAAYQADLDELSTVAGELRSQRRVSELRDHPAIRFLEDRVVASPRLHRQHAVLLGR